MSKRLKKPRLRHIYYIDDSAQCVIKALCEEKCPRQIQRDKKRTEDVIQYLERFKHNTAHLLPSNKMVTKDPSQERKESELVDEILTQQEEVSIDHTANKVFNEPINVKDEPYTCILEIGDNSEMDQECNAFWAVVQ